MTTHSQKNLYLIPTPLGTKALSYSLLPYTKEIVASCNVFFVENKKTARNFFKKIHVTSHLAEVLFVEIGKEKEKEDTIELEETIRRTLRTNTHNGSFGVLSEAGCPGIADPGALVVALAHAEGFRIKPLVGPSSIFLALMASGLEGNRFAFHGYLPIERKERTRAIRELEKQSRLQNQTQIVIETPYRNDALLSALLGELLPTTKLTLATDITTPDEIITTQTVSSWKSLHRLPKLHKRQVVFLFCA